MARYRRTFANCTHIIVSLLIKIISRRSTPVIVLSRKKISSHSAKQDDKLDYSRYSQGSLNGNSEIVIVKDHNLFLQYFTYFLSILQFLIVTPHAQHEQG